MNRLCGFLLACCMAGCGHAQAAVPATLRVCGDGAEFPPYIFYQRVAGQKSAQAAGFDVDVLQRILAASGRGATIVLLPWTRCVALAARGQFDIALDGIRSPMRERDFLLPQSHYTLTPVFLYLRSRPMPQVHDKRAMSGLRICSQAGYNYEPYGVPDSMIASRATSVEASARMLKLGRCDVLINLIETLRGQRALGGADLLHDPDYAQVVPSWLGHVDFYFLVSRAVPYRQALVELLDQGIGSLKKSGELERLRLHQAGH